MVERRAERFLKNGELSQCSVLEAREGKLVSKFRPSAGSVISSPS